jgi:hypothetical protein
MMTGAIYHHIVPRVDVGALGEELVYEVETAVLSGKMERCSAVVRWQRGGAAALERNWGRSGHEPRREECGPGPF